MIIRQKPFIKHSMMKAEINASSDHPAGSLASQDNLPIQSVDARVKAQGPTPKSYPSARDVSHCGAVSFGSAGAGAVSYIYLINIRTPLVVVERVAPVPPAWARSSILGVIVRCSIDPRRGVVLQTSLCVMAVHSVIDGILTGQSGPVAGEELQYFVLFE